MSLTPINLGTVPNDGTGSQFRAGGEIINANFAAIPLGVEGAMVKLVYRTAGARWEFPDGTVPVLTGRRASIAWEGTAAQIPAQGTGAAQFRVGDTAFVRTTTL